MLYNVISCYIMLYRTGSWGLKTNKHTVNGGFQPFQPVPPESSYTAGIIQRRTLEKDISDMEI